MAKKALSITGYNIGVNCGESAVQTIFHVHCHMIPRLDGDIEDPRRIFSVGHSEINSLTLISIYVF